MNQPANDTATPRTDAIFAKFSPENPKPYFHDMTGLARTLERELSQAKERIAKLEGALKPFATIADEYDRNCLDECRPDWNMANDQATELYTGRGGKSLLSLHHFTSARAILNQPTP